MSTQRRNVLLLFILGVVCWLKISWLVRFVICSDLRSAGVMFRCFIHQCKALRFSVCLTKTKPSAAVSWSPLDREVGSAGFVFLWWILDVWDLQQVVSLARSVLTLTEEHISLFGWFHSALIDVQQGAPPPQLFTWLCRSDTGSSLFWLELIKSLIYRLFFFMQHDKLCVPYVIPNS